MKGYTQDSTNTMDVDCRSRKNYEEGGIHLRAGHTGVTNSKVRGWGRMLKTLALVFIIQTATFVAAQGVDAKECQNAFPFKQSESLTKSCRAMYDNGETSDDLTKRITLRKCLAEVLLMAQCEKDSYDKEAYCICEDIQDVSSTKCSTEKSRGTVKLECYSPLVGEKTYYCKKGVAICNENTCSNGWHSPRMSCGKDRHNPKIWRNMSAYGFERNLRVTPGNLPKGYEDIGKE